MQRVQCLFRNRYERILRTKPTPAVNTTMECGGAISWLGGEICGQLHASATSAPANEPTVFIGYDVEWVTETVWTRWGNECFIPAGNRTVSHSYVCFLSFGAESSVFRFDVQKYKDLDIQNCTFTFSFCMGVTLSFSH